MLLLINDEEEKLTAVFQFDMLWQNAVGKIPSEKFLWPISVRGSFLFTAVPGR